MSAKLMTCLALSLPIIQISKEFLCGMIIHIFPLRKEFPLAGIDTPLPAADVAEVTDASVEPAPMMGGPFVSGASGPMSDSEPRAKDESWTEEMEKGS